MRLSQKIILMVLLVAVLVQSCSSLMVVLSFEINQKYIKENFCINVNRPALGCEGKCFLMQKMKAKQQNEQSQTTQLLQTLLEKEWLLGLPKSSFELSATSFFGSAKLLNKREPLFLNTIVLDDLLRPPNYLNC